MDRALRIGRPWPRTYSRTFRCCAASPSTTSWGRWASSRRRWGCRARTATARATPAGTTTPPTARASRWREAMVVMMATINKTHFGGRQAVTCFSCHRGTNRPKLTPDLALLYDAPAPERSARHHRAGAHVAAAGPRFFDKYLAGGWRRRTRGCARPASPPREAAVGYGPDSEKRAGGSLRTRAQPAHDGHPGAGRRQHHHVRRPPRLDCGAVPPGAGARGRGPGPRRHSGGRRAVVSPRASGRSPSSGASASRP